MNLYETARDQINRNLNQGTTDLERIVLLAAILSILLLIWQPSWFSKLTSKLNEKSRDEWFRASRILILLNSIAFFFAVPCVDLPKSVMIANLIVGTIGCFLMAATLPKKLP